MSNEKDRPQGNVDANEYNEKVNADLNTKQAPVDGSNNEGAKKQPPPKVSIREKTTFSWQDVGAWNTSTMKDKNAAINILSSIETYIIDHFYGDWYWNTAIIIGTCFFSWLVARLGGGILSFLFVLFFSNSVYRLEYRRFNRDIRDDMERISASNRLENELETMEWLNSFMDKFWVIYMPALSEQVMFQANEVLKDNAPGFGIEALSLDEFTLGSKAPRVDSIKSYTKKGHDHIEMDWAFSFTPNDTDDMTKNEIKRKINPKVALGVTVGKAFISKSLPILVEDMSFTGRMNIKLKLSQNFPHVKIVSVQFLEAPTIDYALKPVGGDTLGLDIMSFIPGLSSFVNGLIHSNLRPMLYAPNSLDIDVEEIMAQQSNDSIGVAAVTIKRIANLKTGVETKAENVNPFVQLKVQNNGDIDERTSIKKGTTNPVFLETKYLLLNNLNGNHVTFNFFDYRPEEPQDYLIGNLDFPLATLLQKETQLGISKNIVEGGKVVGKVEFDIRWFPVLEPQVLEDGTKEEDTESEVGILKLNLHEAKDLDIRDSPVGLLNPYAEIYINNELVKTTRTLRRKNEPSWEKAFESIITQQSETQVQVIVKDAVEDNIVGKLDANLQDLIFETGRGQEWIKTLPVKEGGPNTRFRISAGWKALAMTDEDVVPTHFNCPIGGLRLHVRAASDLVNLESVGKVDPYIRFILNGKLRAKTLTIAETVDPKFNNVFFFPISNEHQHILMQIMDEEAEGKDRPLGSAAINVNEFLKKNDEGYYLGYDGSNEVIEQPVLYDGETHGYITYSVSFIPTIPTLTVSQIEHKGDYEAEERKKKIEDEKKRKREEALYKANPDKYEWVDIDEDTLPEPSKIVLPLEKAVKYRAGDIAVHIFGGKFDKPDLRLHTLFDDQAYPSGVSPRATGKELTTSSIAESFIRDLPNSKLIFRLTNKAEVNDEKEVRLEKTFDTLDILTKSNKKPILLKLNERNSIKVQLEFFPTAVKLAPLDTILDVGKLKLDILGAENLPSADKNGKSDPFLVIKLDGVEIFKTDKKRKTLDPLWNEDVEFPVLSRSRQLILLEVYDWDLTHDDRLLGLVNLDVSTIDPLVSTPCSVKLNTQGTINLRATFKPEYVRPKLNAKSALPIDLKDLSAGTLKLAGGAAGGVAGVAGGAVGGGVGLAADGATKGASFIKGLGRSRKSKKSDEDVKSTTNGHVEDGASSHAADTTMESSTIGDDYESRISSPTKKENQSFVDDNNTTKSPYTNEMQSLRSGKAPGVAAVPNIDPEGLPPPQRPNVGHRRVTSQATDVSSISPSINGPDAIPGRINIIGAKGYTNNSLEVKVVLKTSSKEKVLHRSRPTKLSKSDGMYKWNESVPFRSTKEGVIEVYLREHHRLGRSVEVGTGVIQLADYVNVDQSIDVPIGEGSVTINLLYFSAAKE